MKNWWRGLTRRYNFGAQHLRVLQCSAEAWDRKTQAGEILQVEGLVVTTRHGERRSHPAVAIERDARLAFVRCVRELALADDDMPAGLAPAAAPWLRRKGLRMPIRQKTRSAPALVVSPSVFRFGDGTEHVIPGEQVYPSPGAAARAWRQGDMRVRVWAGTHRFNVPHAATLYDGITHDGWDVLWTTWNAASFHLGAVLEALAEDRAAVARFQQREPRAAHAIGGFLNLWLNDLDRIEQEARRVAAVDGRPWARGAPQIASALMYGDGHDTQPKRDTHVH